MKRYNQTEAKNRVTMKRALRLKGIKFNNNDTTNNLFKLYCEFCNETTTEDSEAIRRLTGATAEA